MRASRLMFLCFTSSLVLLASGLLIACLGVGAAEQVTTYARRPQLPALIAHRAGTADAPENTFIAIETALANHADMIWLTIQLTKDGIPVLYRPADLSTLTNGSGKVAEKTFAELGVLNAGWFFRQKREDGTLHYPYRLQHVPIPSLRQALHAIPEHIPIVLDLKALPVLPLASAVARLIDEEHAWERVRFYSTEASYGQAFQAYPQARLFELRDTTRQRLLGIALTQRCDTPPPSGTWAGYEFERAMQIIETYTLGRGESTVNAQLWSAPSVQCFRSQADTQLIAFGVNTAATYQTAANLCMDAVLVDSPREMLAIQQRTVLPARCPNS